MAYAIKVSICKVKATRDNKISRYCTDIAQSVSPIYISIVPTSLSKAFVTGVFCDNVALVTNYKGVKLTSYR
jgi:hypothetical protein